MRKRIDPSISVSAPPPPRGWLDLESLATIEMTSEDPTCPIENALLPGKGSGWRASQPGLQTIRILFNEPVTLRHIHLVFTENERPRTQEFALRWWHEDHASFEQIVRQQYTFNPPAREIEDYTVTLNGLKTLELEILPSIGGGDFHASLAELRLR